MNARVRSALTSPEAIAFVLLVAAFAWSVQLSPYFLDTQNLFDMTARFVEVGVMSLSMTLLLIAGLMDLSVASLAALDAMVFGLLIQAHSSLAIAIAVTLFVGMGLGLVNGLIVTRIGVPSLVVTLGLLGLYRGIAQGLAGDHSISGFPREFVALDTRYLGDSPVSVPLVLYVLAIVAFVLLLHASRFGRLIAVVGSNETAARFSGVNVGQVKIALFVLAGLTSAIAGLLYASRLQAIRWDLASGSELDIITAAILGGAGILGGRGSIIGTVIAVMILAVLRNGLGLANVPGEARVSVVGALLILSILISSALAAVPGRLPAGIRRAFNRRLWRVDVPGKSAETLREVK